MIVGIGSHRNSVKNLLRIVMTLGCNLKEFRQETTECVSETKMWGSGPRPYLPCFFMCICDCMHILQWIYNSNAVHGAGYNPNRRRRRHVIRLGPWKKSPPCRWRKRTWFLTFTPMKIWGLKAGFYLSQMLYDAIRTYRGIYSSKNNSLTCWSLLLTRMKSALLILSNVPGNFWT